MIALVAEQKMIGFLRFLLFIINFSRKIEFGSLIHKCKISLRFLERETKKCKNYECMYRKYLQYLCAAKAFCSCPVIISHRPRSKNILKEQALNPEKDSRIKRPRSQVSLEKSSQNYKPLEK